MSIVRRYATEDFVDVKITDTVPSEVILYTPQTLTEEQKAQVDTMVSIMESFSI